MKIGYKKILYTVFPMLTVTAILVTVFNARGIFASDPASIVFSDFAQTTMAGYYHLYDVVHNGKGLFFDYLTGLGTNSYAFMTFNGIFSPLSWLLLLVPRGDILSVIPYFFILKVSLMSLTFQIFLRSTFKKISPILATALSVLYALSGYTLIYYIIFQFLDVAIMFPLILLGLKKLYEEDKILWYIVPFVISTIMCYYTSVMIIFFILFTSPFVLKIMIPKERRGKVITNLALGTFFTALLSAFILIPTFIQISNSIRMSFFNIVATLKSPQNSNTKLLVVLPLSIFAPIVVAVVYKLLTRRLTSDDKKFFAVSTAGILVSGVPIFVEAINLMWHTGSYVLFPLRYGFIVVAAILVFIGYYFDRFSFGRSVEAIPNVREGKGRRLLNPKKRFYETRFGQKIYAFRKNRFIQDPIFIVCILGANHALFQAIKLFKQQWVTINSKNLFSSVSDDIFNMIGKISLLFALAFFLLSRVPKNQLKFVKVALHMTVLTIVSVELIMFTVMMVGRDVRYTANEWSDEYIKISESYNESVEFVGGDMGRVRDRDTSLNSNYPIIMNVPSISGWLHFISPENQQLVASLGYSATYTRTIDTGGTVFSDAFLNVQTIFSKTGNVPKSFYKKAGSSEGLSIYHAKYKLPFGMKYTGNFDDYDLKANQNFKMQNDIYRAITNKDEDIIEIYDIEPMLANASIERTEDKVIVTPSADDEPSIITYDVDVEGTNVLYLDIGDTFGGMTLLTIEVNGEILYSKDYNNQYLLSFPAPWDNGIIELGEFTDEHVEVYITTTKKHSFFYLGELKLGKISANKMEKLENNFKNDSSEYALLGNKFKYQISGKQSEKLVLPISYDQGFSVKINGKKSVVKQVFGNLVGVDLAEGKNQITLSFSPKGFKISALISLFGLGMLLIFLKFKNVQKVVYGKVVTVGLQMIYWLIAILLLVTLYVFIPIATVIYK